MRRWRTLHKLTYLVAAALLAHVILIGDIGPGAVLIALGFIGRIPVIRRRLTSRAERRRKTTLARSDRDMATAAPTRIVLSRTLASGPRELRRPWSSKDACDHQ